jgi:hypothetical protein
MVSIPSVFNDVNERNNSAQQNLKEIASSQSSPYGSVTYKFGFTNPEDTKELFYFRVEGIPDHWFSELNPAKAHLDPDQRIECSLKVKPPDDAEVCTDHPISVTSWIARGHTLLPVGGGTVQVDLRERTNMTVTAELTDCNPEYIKKFGEVIIDPNPNNRERGCMAILAEGCTTPPRPNEEIILRYEHPDGYPIYRTVVTDENGCYTDQHVVAEGGLWEIKAEYPGNDCAGPSSDETEVDIDIPRTHDQDDDNVPDKDEPQGDHDGDGLIGIYDPDSDNDGVRDGRELPGDCDRDGLDNIVDEDSDGDGIIDGKDRDPYETCRPPLNDYGLSAHIGMAIPTVDLTENYKRGVNFLLDVEYHLDEAWSLVGFFGYNQFVSTQRNVDDTYVLNVSANLRYQYLLQYPLFLYVGAGPGVYIPKTGNTEFDVNIGLGLNYKVDSHFALEWGADWHCIFNPQLQFVHTHIGLVYNF